MTDRVPVRADLADVEPYGAPQLDVAVRLNTNETPYPPPAAFYDELAERIRDLPLHRYPDRRATALRRALGARYGLGPEQVWAANGSNEVLQQLYQAYGGPSRRLLLFRPGYSMHGLLAKVTLTPATTVDLDDDYNLSAASAAAAIADVDPDVVCIASPNAPTGVAVDLAAVRALHDASRALVILDQAYGEFLTDPEADPVRLLADLPRLVVVRTFSKAWRLAGLRLGYLLAPAWVIDDVRKVRLPYHLDALTQQAGIVAVEHAGEVTAHIAPLIAERERVRRALAGLDDVEVFDSAGNFLLLRTAVTDLWQRLLDHGVLVRDFSRQPRLEGCLRVTIGTPEENDTFLSALKESLQP
jgi:histidinol-phosphate aminotransferase